MLGMQVHGAPRFGALMAVGGALALAAAAPNLLAASPAPAAFSSSADPLLVQHAAALWGDPHTQVLGNPRGDVTVVEFFDYACPFCKAAEPRLEALLGADKGVKLVVKEFPVLSPESIVASKAALAAARQGKYVPFHQALLSHKGGLDEPVIFSVAGDVGLDVVRLRRDMASPLIAREIADNLELARAIGVHGTPTFIVGGHTLTQPSALIDFPAVVATARRKGG